MRVCQVSKKSFFKPQHIEKLHLLIATVCLWISFNVMAAEVLVDPTRPIEQSRILSGKQQYTLNAIFIAHDRRHVVINGRQISEGGTSGLLKVLKIRSHDVVVLIDGKNKILRLHRSMRKNVNQIVKEEGVEIKSKSKSEMVSR